MEDINKIKEALNQEKHNVDTEEIWNNISHRLPRPRRRKYFLLIFFSLFAVAVISSFIVLTDIQKEIDIEESRAPIVYSNPSDLHTENKNHSVQQKNNIQKENHNPSFTKTTNQKVSEKMNERFHKPSAKEPASLLTNENHSIQPNLQKTSNAKQVLYNPTSKSVVRLQNPDLINIIPIASVGLPLNAQRSYENLSIKTMVKPASRIQHYFVSAMIGANISHIQTHIKNSEINGLPNYIKEKGATGFSYSIGAGKTWKNGLRLRINLHSAHYYAQYRNTSSQITNSSATGITHISINENNEAQEHLGTITRKSLVNKNVLWHRRHRLYNINVLLEKSILRKGRYDFSLYGGFRYNMYTQTKGYFIDPQNLNEIIKFNESENAFFKKSFGLSPVVGLGVGYRVRNISYQLSYEYDRIIRPIISNNSEYSINHSQTGVQFGIRYHL